MTHLLDTNIVLLHLAGRLGERLPGGVHGVSVITEIETLSWAGLDDASERRIREFLKTVRVIELDRAAAESAIAIRRAHGVKTPDAIIAGTARAMGLKLVTNDARLLRLEVAGLDVLSIPLANGRE
ncbi:MAG: type II toxin-antitoxin system VapC family toxin [Phycisphaerales bacterium]